MSTTFIADQLPTMPLRGLNVKLTRPAQLRIRNEHEKKPESNLTITDMTLTDFWLATTNGAETVVIVARSIGSWDRPHVFTVARAEIELDVSDPDVIARVKRHMDALVDPRRD